MKKNTATFLYVILIIALILFLCWMVFWLRSESSNCVRNPVKYFQEKNPEIECKCYGKEEGGFFGKEINFSIKP